MNDISALALISIQLGIITVLLAFIVCKLYK